MSHRQQATGPLGVNANAHALERLAVDDQIEELFVVHVRSFCFTEEIRIEIATKNRLYGFTSARG